MNINKYITKFENKVFWITGASSGIGEDLAYTLSKLGAKLILSARNEEKLNEVKKSCKNPEAHLVVPIDLEKNENFEAEVNIALEHFGKIDNLILSGAVGQFEMAINTNPEIERKIFETNYFGTVSLAKAILPSMFKCRSGHIVVISSLMGKFGPPMRTSYAASKHALHGYFDSLRAEIWREGIFVTIVCPGFIKTNISKNYLDGKGNRWDYIDKDHQNAMSPEKCSGKILKAIASEKYEVNVAGKEVFAVFVKRFFPRILIRIMKNYSFKRAEVNEK
jgi:dehydrogenase/reductase SDR family protein 7B